MKIQVDQITACQACGALYQNFLAAAEHEANCSNVPRIKLNIDL